MIFYSNGYEHWLWDDVVAPLGQVAINPDIAGRYYQERAIRRICEAFEVDAERKALVVMATGAGKTRAVAAPLKFQRRGIRYGDLSEEEKDAWDALEWDTEDKILADVMAHADFIAERFDANYPELRGRFARVISHRVT